MMVGCSLREIVAVAGGEPSEPLLRAGVLDRPVGRIVTDTRAGLGDNDVFVGLRGPNFRGERFAEQAVREGAMAAVVARDAELDPSLPVVRVDDPLFALQALAAWRRSTFRGTVVGITGSNGKTIVKEMLGTILAASHAVYRSPMSWNSQVGVARALLDADDGADLWLIECGVSEPGEMDRLREMVDPDIGVLVHVGEVHLQGLGSMAGVAREKARLFVGQRCQRVFLPDDATAGDVPAILAGAGVTVERIRTRGGPSEDVDDPAAWLASPLDRVPFLQADVRLSAEVALALGAKREQARAAMRSWTPAEMRMELLMTPRGVLLVNDAYTSDPTSLEGALEVFSRERSRGRAIAVLGGLADQGGRHAEATERAGRALAARAPDVVVGVGSGGRDLVQAAVAQGLPVQAALCLGDRAEAAQWLELNTRPGDRVLLKGARPERLEALVETFFDGLAPARLFVDLDQVRENYRQVRRRVGPGVEVMAVLKAFGYGLDAVRLARALEGMGADHFAVAYPDEGVQLRERGISQPILVQHVPAAEAAKVVRHGLAAQVAAPEQIGVLDAVARAHGVRARIHLKIETGMGRAGVRAEAVGEVVEALRGAQHLVLDGVMTHLAASEAPAQDDATRQQLRRFEHALASLRDAGLAPGRVHAANSAAIARFPEAHYTMVRLGLGLLGCTDRATTEALGVRPVLRFVTRVLSLQKLAAGDAVGYGRTFVASAPMVVAVVGVGYADGLPWSLGNVGWVGVAGRRAPIVGRVCMDVTMVDVTGLPAVAPGDEVVVYGDGPLEPSVSEMAELAGTIPYELLTRLAPRVRRIFTGER